MNQNNVIILGSGPAGYTAAIYAARANLKPIIITGNNIGGQLASAFKVDNWPGEFEGINGLELMEKMKKQAEKFGVKIIYDNIKKVNLKNKPFELLGENDNYKCNALIVATGVKPKQLGLESESKYFGRGVSECFTCDGFFYKDKIVGVTGGGNTAISGALYLSEIAKKVILIHRRDVFRTEKIILDKLNEKVSSGKIELKTFNVVKEILGDEQGVNKIKIENTQKNKNEMIDVDGIFVLIGHNPNTDIFKGELELDNQNFIKINGGNLGLYSATNIEGVFAAGDVVEPRYKQAIVAAADGCRAALDVEEYFLNKSEIKK